MINVYTNRENYQYDLHALLKSFYPEHDVRVYAAEVQEEHQDSENRVIVQLFHDRCLLYTSKSPRDICINSV